MNFKKYFLLTVLSMFFFNISMHGQENSNAFDKEGKQFDVYIGGPNLTTTVLKVLFKSDFGSNYKEVEVKGSPVFGARYLMGYDDMVSVGLEINYKTNSVDFSQLAVLTSDTISEYNYHIKSTRVNFLIRGELHPDFIDDPNLDIYFPAGIGFRYNKNQITTNDPGDNSYFNGRGIKAGLLSFRFGMGMRYYIAESVGINLELGLGSGALAEVGIAFKI